MTPTLGLAMIGYTIGYALAALTRTHDGNALRLPVPLRLRRFVGR